MSNIYTILSQNLTQEQYQAATDTTNEILCLACAGSGKSRTLAFRIARLIAEGESPESIIAFTFTDKAAEAIKRRVAEALSSTGFEPALLGAMYIGTIHSYCKYLLGEMDARYHQYEVLDTNKLKLYLISRYYQLGLKNFQQIKNSKYFNTINEVTKAWSVLNDELLDLNQVIQQDLNLGTILQTLYDSLCRDQYIDFSLMVRLVVEALQNSNSRIDAVIQGIRHLMVDEYQDINPLQEQLIREIHNRTGTLFVVGDDDQAIYAWRGADVNNILTFPTRYPRCSTHTLSINFRSTPAIIESSSLFVMNQLGPLRMPKNPTPSNDNLNKSRHFGKHWFDTRREEAEWVANRINDLLGKSYEEKDSTIRGLCRSDFAILMSSTNGDEQDGTVRHTAFTQALDSLGIKYTIEAQESIFNFPVANVLRDTFELLRNRGLDRTKLQNHFNNTIVPIFPNADFNEISRVLTNWLRLIHDPHTGTRRRVYPQKFLHEILHAFRIQTTPFDDTQLQAMGIFSKIMEDVESVYMSVDSTGRFQAILNFLNILAEDGYETRPDEVLQRPDAVFISTIHKAKGLEFPVVFVVDVEQGRMPGQNRNYRGWLPSNLIRKALNRGAYQNNREGDIRVFYTAITRAERYLYVTGSKRLPGARSDRKQSVFYLDMNHPEIESNHTLNPIGLVNCPQVQRIDETVVPTTFSEIKYYLSCPKNYQFRKQYGFSPHVPALYGYGQTIHTTIGKLHELFSERAPTIEQAEEVTRDIFNLKHVPPSRDPVNNPGPYERALEKAVEVVSEYTKSYQQEFSTDRQVEVRFEIPACQALITGAIDLLLREDKDGNIIEATVIDFKSLKEPDDSSLLDWIELSLQVQLYAKAANEVLGENAKTGAVHLLRDNKRVVVPVINQAIEAAAKNIEWAVDRIINRDYPMRPHSQKCEKCDFNLLCAKIPQDFKTSDVPPAIYLPTTVSNTPVLVKAFSEFEN